MHVIVCTCIHVHLLFRTHVVQDVLDNVLDLVKYQVVLRPLACVSVYSHSWSICEVALLDIEPFDADIVQEQEGTLAHVLAMVVKVTVHYFLLFRSGAVVTLQCGGLVGVSHDLSHHKQVQLIMAHLSKGGSEGLVVFDWKEHGAGSLLRAKVTATALANKLLHLIALLVIQLPHLCHHLAHI